MTCGKKSICNSMRLSNAWKRRAFMHTRISQISTHFSNFVSNTIKRDYIWASSACIMINHFLRIRIICFCKSRMRTSCQLFRWFWKTIGTSKMTNSGWFIMEVNHEQTHDIKRRISKSKWPLLYRKFQNYVAIHGCFVQSGFS